MAEEHRAIARQIAQEHLLEGDSFGWFEVLYSRAKMEPSIIPWADLKPNPNLVQWLDQNQFAISGRALTIGCGLGDDAEELVRRGFATTAFDISPSAIMWSRKRFPRSSASYIVADLLSAPANWVAMFDFVLESYTLQVLPFSLRSDAMRCISSFVAPGGILLVIARGREPSEPEGKMPWPLTKEELSLFKAIGFKEIAFKDFIDSEEVAVRRFVVTYRREIPED
jgi:SAM-dependent methyltransferase